MARDSIILNPDRNVDKSIKFLFTELLKLNPDDMTDEDANLMYELAKHSSIQYLLTRAKVFDEV